MRGGCGCLLSVFAFVMFVVICFGLVEVVFYICFAVVTCVVFCFGMVAVVFCMCVAGVSCVVF